MISIVIPTIAGREESLQRAVKSYVDTTPDDTELIIETGHATCGSAWQAGASKAKGDYICLGADDHEPLDGWWEPLVEACDLGFCPCSVVLNSNGSVQSAGMVNWNWNLVVEDCYGVEHTLTPFMSREQWELVQPIPVALHYCTDIWVSARLRHHGITAAVRSSSRVIHHYHPVGRGAGMEENARNIHDRELFFRLIREMP